jgi:hypothetical protein
LFADEEEGPVARLAFLLGVEPVSLLSALTNCWLAVLFFFCCMQMRRRAQWRVWRSC